MGELSNKLTQITFGVSGTPPTLSRCTINNAGNSTGVGTDSGTGLISSGDFKSATKVWNAVWNDIADFQLLNDELAFGYCYYDTLEGARLCNQRCQMAVMGIASNTFGFGVGAGANTREVPIAVAGWVLAHVDREYPCGTPLTNAADARLTAMTLQEKRDYPERLVALYKGPERRSHWGPSQGQIEVCGRHWVKVK